MNQRNVIGFLSLLLAAGVMGCSDEGPTHVAAADRFFVDPAYIGLDPGEVKQLNVTLGGTATTATFTSSNPAVATVTAAGAVTAVSPGFSAVEARSGTFVVTSNITVLPLLGTALTPGTGLTIASSGARNSSVLYRVTVPTGKTNLKVTLTGGTGDADIYIRKSSPPTTASGGSTCKSENGGNEETCNIANPAAGTWYILVVVWDAYAGATLTASYTP